jgi:uncharacterized coiled-coil protein SlyX
MTSAHVLEARIERLEEHVMKQRRALALLAGAVALTAGAATDDPATQREAHADLAQQIEAALRTVAVLMGYTENAP